MAQENPYRKYNQLYFYADQVWVRFANYTRSEREEAIKYCFKEEQWIILTELFPKTIVDDMVHSDMSTDKIIDNISYLMKLLRKDERNDLMEKIKALRDETLEKEN